LHSFNYHTRQIREPFDRIGVIKGVRIDFSNKKTCSLVVIGYIGGCRMLDSQEQTPEEVKSFFDRPRVHVEKINIGPGIPLGIERVSNPKLGIGGAYGTWGEAYSNNSLALLVEDRSGEPLRREEALNLSELGFINRHHIAHLTEEEHLKVEIEVGSRFLREAAAACGWKPSEVQAVLVGSSGPVSDDFTERIANEAGIPESALKVSIHKACDGSVAALNLALNPGIDLPGEKPLHLAEQLYGKKVLLGGIEGLSRFTRGSRDKNALQLFGNGAGIIGVIPGKTMKFLVGSTREVFDEEGVLQVHMYYPHSGHRTTDHSMIEVTQPGSSHLRVAGLMHEPESEDPVVMAGPMGMVKLFVRSGVQVVQDVYGAYQRKMNELGVPGKEIVVAIVHHANFKINQLKEKHLQREGIQIPMPWLLKEFGNVSAASNMIAFLRKLSDLIPGDNILFDGFGAGTYYDVLAVELGG
jgi:3-oxoacyl-[acyl-carrier-protein] synthase III